jgi:hypothetical protein
LVVLHFIGWGMPFRMAGVVILLCESGERRERDECGERHHGAAEGGRTGQHVDEAQERWARAREVPKYNAALASIWIHHRKGSPGRQRMLAFRIDKTEAAGSNGAADSRGAQWRTHGEHGAIRSWDCAEALGS